MIGLDRESIWFLRFSYRLFDRSLEPLTRVDQS